MRGFISTVILGVVLIASMGCGTEYDGSGQSVNNHKSFEQASCDAYQKSKKKKKADPTKSLRPYTKCGDR